MNLRLRPYVEQTREWPAAGRHILAQFDADSIVVYQAYGPSIAQHAVEHQRFGGAFSFNRMSWIKPNFLWMMYRSGWATKQGQERILAVRLRRQFFDELLLHAVPSTFDETRFANRATWQSALAASEVRLQWDPDHDPGGRRVARRALQLGLRGTALRRYGEQEATVIDDVTDIATEQRRHIVDDWSQLLTPDESLYRPTVREAALAVRIDTADTR